MFNKRTLSIIKRELRSKLFSKSFLLMTLLIPVLIFGAMGLQTYIMTFEGNDKNNIIIASEDQVILDKMQDELKNQPYVKDGKISFDYKMINKKEFDSFIEQNTSKLLEDKLTGAFYISGTSLKDKKIEYYSKNPKNQLLFDKLKAPMNSVFIQNFFAGKNISESEINFLKENVDINTYRISGKGKAEAAGYGNTIVAFIFTFLLYMSLIITGQMMMRAVVEEKNNRIVELLLSSISSNELMTGKIIGTAITGLMQMAIWLLPIVLLVSTTWFVLPEELIVSLSAGQIFFFLYNYLIAIVTFLGLFASVGAIFDNDQDAQSGIWPIMILIMIPFFIALGMQGNPDNKIANITSMLPFGSLIVMPARMASIDVPAWQFILSIVVNLLTMLAIFPVAGKVYRVGILLTGRKPSWGEVIKWVKA